MFTKSKKVVIRFAGLFAVLFVLEHSPASKFVYGQNEDARIDRYVCGRNSLSLILAFQGSQNGQDRLEELLPSREAPFSFEDLRRAVDLLGYQAYVVHWKSLPKSNMGCPSIIRVRMSRASGLTDHFLACFGETRDGLCVADFPSSPFILPWARLKEIWDGNVLFVERQGGSEVARLRNLMITYRISWSASALIVLGTLIALSCGAKHAISEE